MVYQLCYILIQFGTIEIVKIVVSFVIGFVAVVVGLVFMQKRTLELLVEDSDTRKDSPIVNSLIFNKKVYNQGPKIVVIGGGSGLNTVLRGLKNYTDNITAIVTMLSYENDGDNSKKTLQMLPLDDIKESIIALSHNEEAMSNLLNVKFNNGQLRNLRFDDIYISSMNTLYNNEAKSIEQSKEVLNITGKVLPATLEEIRVCAELEDGKVLEDKDKITEYISNTSTKISRVYINPTNNTPAPGVKEAIQEADAIIIGPGSLYTNVIPNLLIKGIAKEIKESKAIKVYISNIMTELGQTDEYSLSDHIKAINEYVGKGVIDYCVYDTGEIIPEFIKKYNLEGSDIVLPDEQKTKEMGVKLIQRNLSTIKDGLIRHDSNAVAETIIQLVCDEFKFRDMQNDNKYVLLNSKLKERKKINKKENKKTKSTTKKAYERKPSTSKSKFNDKYKERVESIKNSDEKRSLRKQIQEIDKMIKEEKEEEPEIESIYKSLKTEVKENKENKEDKKDKKEKSKIFDKIKIPKKEEKAKKERPARRFKN